MSEELAVIDSATISAEEGSKVAQLLKLLQSKPDWAKDIEQPLLDGYEDGLQRPALLRWLRARKWDVPLAAQCICEHAVWRKTLCGPSHRFTGTEFPVHTAAKKVLLAGPDRSGRPALVGLVRQHFSDTNDPDGFKRFLTYVLDTAVAVGKAKAGPDWDGKLVGILCLHGVGWSNCDVSALKDVFELLQNHYVERLHKLYFYNAPTLFVTTWKLLAPFVDPVTRAKVECVAPSQAQDCFSRSFNMDQLPGLVEGGTGPTMLITDLDLFRSVSLGDFELLTAKAQQLQGLQAG